MTEKMADHNEGRKYTVSCEMNLLRIIGNKGGRNYTEEKMQDIKPFSWESCPFTSKWKGDGNSHVREMHGNDLPIYACEFCPFTSKWRSNVKKTWKTEAWKRNSWWRE